MPACLLPVNIFIWVWAAFSILNKNALKESGKLFTFIISFFLAVTLTSFLYFTKVILCADLSLFLLALSAISFCVLFTPSFKLRKLFDIHFLQKPSNGTAIVLLLVFIISYIFTEYSNRWGAGWDALAIWNMHAKFLAIKNYWSNYLTNNIEWTHPDYPLMLSSYIAMFWNCLSSASPLVPSVIAYIVLLAIPLLSFSSLKQNKSGFGGILFFILMCINFKFTERAASQYSDTLLGLFYLISMILVRRYNGKNVPVFFLAGFFAASCGWIKNEGIFYFLVFSFFVLKSNFKNVSLLKKYASGAAIPLFIILVFKLLYAPSNDLVREDFSIYLHKLVEIERYETILVFFFNILISDHIFILPLLVILILLQRNYFTSFEFKVLAATIAGYFLIYLVTPHDLTWHLESSCTRLFHQLYPSLLYSMIAALGSSRLAFNAHLQKLNGKLETWIEK